MIANVFLYVFHKKTVAPFFIKLVFFALINAEKVIGNDYRVILYYRLLQTVKKFRK